MTPKNSNVAAVRAVLAVFIRRTAGRLLLGIALVTGIIGLLAGYNAWRGMTLLWIISTVLLLIAIVSALLGLVVYFITSRVLPRRLSRAENKTIGHFTNNLQKRLQLLKVPLPLFVWNLLMQVVINAQESKEQKRLTGTIERSKSLSNEFAEIKSFFKTT